MGTTELHHCHGGECREHRHLRSLGDPQREIPRITGSPKGGALVASSLHNLLMGDIVSGILTDPMLI